MQGEIDPDVRLLLSVPCAHAPCKRQACKPVPTQNKPVSGIYIHHMPVPAPLAAACTAPAPTAAAAASPQAVAEQSARVDAQERLNMQYFKSHLLADMLVAKLLDLEQQPAGAAALPAGAALATGAVAVVHVGQQQPAGAAKQALAGGQTAAALPQQQQQQVVLAESSFD